ncbi:MAG: hypothetical protein NE330_15915 [Lentisphaeraceae bacterium]|nr:hypothetical protein [Lentisphaeraceae bacterium]
MKCPRCEADVRQQPPLNETALKRPGVICLCGYRFIFHPKVDGISDNLFSNYIEHLSFSDQRYFTYQQFLMLYPHHLKDTTKFGFGAFIIIFFLTVLSSFLIHKSFFFIGFILLGTTMFLCKLREFTTDEKKAHLKKWQKYSGKLEKLLENSSINLEEDIPQSKEEDIFDYGIQSILITQTDKLVNLLVLNEFHTDNQCLVISESGYPSHLHEKAKNYLQEQPDLKVFLLHNASEDGENMKERLLKNSELPLKKENIEDMGIKREELSQLKFFKQYNFHKKESVSAEAIPFTIMASGFLIFQFDEIASLTDASYKKATELIGYDVSSDGGSDFG